MGRSARPDLLRRLLLEDRLRLRPRAALRRGVALARHLPHLPLRRRTGDDRRTPASTTTSTGTRCRCCPASVRATVNVRQYSDLLFQQHYQDNFNLATTRTERWSGVAREGPASSPSLSASPTRPSTYFGTDYTRVNGRLPGLTLRRFPRQIGWGRSCSGFEATAEPAPVRRRGRRSTTGRASTSHPTSRGRSRSASWSSTPSVGYRYTRYGASYGRRRGRDESRVVGPPDRPLVLRDADRDARADLLARLRHARASATPSASST